MRKIKLFLSLLMVMLLSVGNVWADEQLAYTLVPAVGSNNNYASNCDVEITDITWNVTGNSTLIPWRIGGKSLSGVNREVYSKTAMSDAITKVELEVGAASSITVNSVKLIVASNNDFSTKIDEVSETFAASSTITFAPTSPATQWATGAYYKFVFNVSVSGTSNKFVEFKGAKFYTESSDVIVKTLKSIAVAGMTMSYDQGDAFSFDGTCTATYSVTKNNVSQADENKVVTPTEVTSPDMSTTGNKTITVSYTEDAVTRTITYNITVAAAEGDKLTRETTGVTGTSYSDWNEKSGASGAVYAGNSAGGNESIQLRSKNSNSGIISTTSGGLIKKVKVVWNSNTSNGAVLNVYGSNTAYTAASDLYGENSGTPLGTIVCGTSTQLEITSDYEYVGVRSNSGAMYLESITFVWEAGKQLESIAVKTNPDKVSYNIGDAFDATGLVITATYDDSSSEDIAYAGNEDKFSFTGFDSSAAAAAQAITVTYGNKNTTFNVEIKDATLQTVTVDGTPTTTSYTAGDAFDPAGLTVTGHYSDNSDAPITSGITWSYPDANNNLAVDQASIRVVATVEEIASEPYTVNGLTVAAAPLVASWVASEHYNETTDMTAETVAFGPSNNFSIVFGAGTNSNAPKYYTSGEAVRAYGGNTFALSSTGYKFKEIVIGFGSSDGSNAISANVGTYDAGTWTGNSKEVIFTIGGTTGNRRIASITVTYVEAQPSVATPTFSVAEGTYFETQNVTITTATAGATIYYTTDGTEPTTGSSVYSDPIAVSTNMTIKAIAVKDGLENSAVASATYAMGPIFASLEDLVAADLTSNTMVKVSFSNVAIKKIDTNKKYVTFDIQKEEKDIEIYFSAETLPTTWAVGGTLSGTILAPWVRYEKSNVLQCWELKPEAGWQWTDLTYNSPITKTIDYVTVTGTATKTAYVDGEVFDPAGLIVTLYYTDETSEVVTEGITWAPTTALTEGTTSVNVTATVNDVTSAALPVDVTVTAIPTKTIAEFIEAGGGRCYLVGTVSNITNTTYGNFDLTDASGSIYVYGCLDEDGASKNFASLDVVADDYIKVIAETYEYYNNETHEAKDVQFVAELEKPEVAVTSVSVANATVKINKTVQLTATVLPVDATNKNVTWSVKEGSEAYAEVSATGVVTGKAEGNAVIVATSVADNTKFGECTVTVTGGINFAAGDFVLVEDAAELTEGTYVIVAGSGDNNAAMKYYAGSDNNHKAKAAIKEGKYLHYDFEFGVYEIKNYVVNTEVVGISFYNDDAENYFAVNSNSNELKISADQNNNSSWTVAVNEGVTTLTNKAFDSRKLRYNSGSNLFAAYASGQKDIALYKYVTPAAYRVYYNDNVAEEEIEVPAYQSVDGENKVTITTVEPVRDGYLFGGWKDGEANVYEAGVEYTLSADLTLYAQWTTATVSTLSYNPNGGSLISGETAIADAEAAEGANLTIEANVYEKGDNYVFAGWQLGDDVYQPGDPFVMPANDVEFVAKWNEIEVSDYTLVTDLAQLQSGDKIIIVAADYNVAAGSQAATYRSPITIGKTASKNNLILAGYTTPTEFTLGISDGKFSFNDGDGYMYENAEKSVKVQEDPYYWTISIDAEAIATITGTNPLLYNSNSGQERFTTYTSSQKDLQLYRKPGEPVYTTVRKDLTPNAYYTMCLENEVTAVQGASIWRVLSKAQNGTDVILEEVTGKLDAGRPYIFYATADKLEVVYTGAAVSTPVEEGNNGLVGSFTQEQIGKVNTNYIIYNNALYYVNTDNVYVGAHRAYLDMTNVPNYSNEPQQGNAPRRRVTMAVHGPQVATGIDALNASDAPVKVLINGQLFIIRGEKMFDAKGQLVK